MAPLISRQNCVGALRAAHATDPRARLEGGGGGGMHGTGRHLPRAPHRRRSRDAPHVSCVGDRCQAAGVASCRGMAQCDGRGRRAIAGAICDGTEHHHPGDQLAQEEATNHSGGSTEYRGTFHIHIYSFFVYACLVNRRHLACIAWTLSRRGAWGRCVRCDRAWPSDPRRGALHDPHEQ